MNAVDLFTVKVFQESKKPISDSQSGGYEEVIHTNDVISEHQNMISASIVKGRMVELQHLSLVEPDVKFKTVINFDKALERGISLGVMLTPQCGFIPKTD